MSDLHLLGYQFSLAMNTFTLIAGLLVGSAPLIIFAVVMSAVCLGAIRCLTRVDRETASR